MARISRFLLALALALAWELTPPAAEPAEAACTTASCATLEIVFGHGAGTGLVTTFPGGMDCEWTGTTRTGTCVAQYDVGAGRDITLFLDPGVHSYACYGLTCAGLETRLERTVRLNPGDNIDVFPIFNLGVRGTLDVSFGGTGDGRVTSVPAGLNCRWLDGVKSGTCRADFYFYPADSYRVQINRIPDPGNFACSTEPPFCGIPDETYVASVGVGPTGIYGAPASFFEARPVAVSVSGSGSVVSDPAGISCPGACSVWLPPNYSNDPPKLTKLTASPAAGWFVKDWTGACDATTGATCEFFNSTSGATVGVVFAQTGTPQPSASAPPTPRPTPRPTATTRPTASPPPSSSSPASPSPAPATVEPGASLGPATQGPESAAPESPVPTPSPELSSEPSAATVEPSGAPLPGSSQEPVPVVEPGQPGAGDVVVLLLVAIGVLAGLLVLGYMLGRLGRRTKES